MESKTMNVMELAIRSARSRGLALVLALALAGCCCPESLEKSPGSASDSASSHWTRLFNGRDLIGWVQILDSPWVVEDGALVARQDPQGRREGESWLFSERSFRDFRLRLKFRITPGGNSGVFLRDPIPAKERQAVPDGGAAPWDAGYEVNINNDEPNYPTGSVWAALKGPPKLQKEGEWNDLDVQVEGNRISTWINGQPALADAVLPERSKAGAIGFQRHGGAAYRDKVVELKDVEVLER
jgi:hypothetical protein